MKNLSGRTVHIDIFKKCGKVLNLMRAGQDWGADKHSLKGIYVGLMR